jgi:hypothetical protein
MTSFDDDGGVGHLCSNCGGSKKTFHFLISLSTTSHLSLIFCIPLQLSPSHHIMMLKIEKIVQRERILPWKNKILVQKILPRKKKDLI